MHRRRHQSLSTVGGPGQGAAVEEPDVRPDVWSIPKRCRSPGGGGHPPSPDPDVGGPKKQRLGAPSPPHPDVGLLHPPDPRKDAGAAVPHLAVSGAGGGAPLHLGPYGGTDVEGEGPHPDVEGARNGGLVLVEDSDTDVEGEGPHADVGTPQPGHRLLVVDSDPDVEGSPDAGSAQSQMWRKEDVLVMETPKPDVGGPQGADTDTDGEDEDLTQCFLHPWRPPAVVLESPIPDAGTVPPDPAVSPTGSDTDGGEVAPTPDVRGLRSRVQFQMFPNPDVGGSGARRAPNSLEMAPESGSDVGRIPSCNDVSPDPDVEATGPDMVTPSPDAKVPNPDVATPDPDVVTSSPDVRTPNPDVKAPDPDVRAPNLQVLAPNPAMAAPNPDVGAQERNGKTPVPVPAVPLDASTPNSQHLDSCSGGADGTESDSDDVDLFLEPTQSFLPPADQASPQRWDPEEPTQLFCPPEEGEEEPPQPPPQPPPKEGTKEEGPRRSQRLARNRGGGAKGGVAEDEAAVVGGAPLGTAPLRRSLRLLARPPPAEPRPTAAKPRPRRAGTSQSRRRAQDKEEEPIEVQAPQLRPRRNLGSSPPKVLFTGLVASEAMEEALSSLGGSVASSVFDCTHLVTDRVRRTVKFLCAVARGVPIVTPNWLHKSATSGRILAPGPFLVQDRQQERHFGFSLAQALQRARRHPLLQGYEIHVTPSVRPEPEHMKDIITCSGGTFLPTMPSTYRPRCVVVSCPADAWCWAPALSSRLPLASPELLLTGLLRQRLQLQPFLLPLPPAQTPPNPPPPRSRGPPRTRRRQVGPPQ